ncbi:hypothetical protein LOD99_4363 [Oopsacas minuta]|uniref:DUF4190 domain-containing protein n=1 Tax=Oopsacas minuta TaxID=111878 RepID=A0AAV7JUF3_9METZ|nr:hypothetical protein LOD99_4363 [Oopsacas minuta]
MTEEKTALVSQQRTNTSDGATLQTQEAPITERALLITAVLVILGYFMFGFPGLLAGIFLVIAYLKFQKGEYDKAILYNRIARVIAIIFLVIGIIVTLMGVVFLLLYFAIYISLKY